MNQPKRSWRRLFKRVLLGLLLLLVLGVVVTGLWMRRELGASLPELEGEMVLAGLEKPVSITRDALGIPTLRGDSRVDVALATGFVHAQDRFFQMDLQRRRAAGELSEMLGSVLLPADRRIRVHRLREVARQAFGRLSDEDRRLLEAYAEGVNAGLSSLGARPFEYVLLQARPEPWAPEDSLVVVLAMFVELQDEGGDYETTITLMHDLLPELLFEYLLPEGTGWDAPMSGGPVEPTPIPGPEIFDLRAGGATSAALVPARVPAAGETMGESLAGSNSWAVAGSRSSDGRALLANDMHMGLSVPNIWYRAAFSWPADDGGTAHEVIGATLPGTPLMVVGSNTHIAWGFTNSRLDASDLILIERDPEREDAYLTPDGSKSFERHRERIRARWGTDEDLEVVSTVWGPVIGEDHAGRLRAVAWVGHRPEAVNLRLRDLEVARGVDEAVLIANRSGVPTQNFTVADRQGRIAWTVAGRIPRRVGLDGRMASSWTDGSRRWDGWLTPEEYPRITDPETGRLWTANNRVVDREETFEWAHGRYEFGARARRIHDLLFTLEEASEADMLRIQLDDEAPFLTAWRDLLLEILTPEAIAGNAERQELREFVADWQGHAAADSVGYRYVRGYRAVLAWNVFGNLTVACRAKAPGFDYSTWVLQFEDVLWQLIREQPAHLLDPRFASWDEFLLATVDETLRVANPDGDPLESRTWGQFSMTRVQHPLSRILPLAGRWLDMPAQPLPGDIFVPRVQFKNSGASERMVVSPGHESEGIFHMPGGQSGHPFSPHYRDAHSAWVEGEPTPFLPGEPVHVLRLVPRG